MSNERTIRFKKSELWALQGLVKPLVPDGSQTTVVVATVQLEGESVPAPMTLRQKINSGLLEIADAPTTDYVNLALSAEELWVVDSVLNREMGDWAESLLVSVFRAFDSLSMGIPLMSGEEFAARPALEGSDGKTLA